MEIFFRDIVFLVVSSVHTQRNVWDCEFEYERPDRGTEVLRKRPHERVRMLGAVVQDEAEARKVSLEVFSEVVARLA